MRPGCVHAATAIKDVPAPLDVCEACILIGGEWVHLRQCLTCARTLCCDNSPNRHMTGHFHEIGHPVMRGAAVDDDWTWCFLDDAMIREADGRWETYDPFLEMGAAMAAGILKGGGTLDVRRNQMTDEGFPIGEWVAYVRGSHGDGSLNPDDTAVVEQIPGWEW